MDLSNIENIEKTNVKDVYEKIAEHFKVTRVYTWSWIKKFVDEQIQICEQIYKK